MLARLSGKGCSKYCMLMIILLLSPSGTDLQCLGLFHCCERELNCITYMNINFYNASFCFHIGPRYAVPYANIVSIKVSGLAMRRTNEIRYL